MSQRTRVNVHILARVLTHSGMLRPQEMSEFQDLCRSTGLHPRQVALWSGYLNKRQIDVALETARLVDLALISIEHAIQATRTACLLQLPLAVALHLHGGRSTLHCPVAGGQEAGSSSMRAIA